MRDVVGGELFYIDDIWYWYMGGGEWSKTLQAMCVIVDGIHECRRAAPESLFEVHKNRWGYSDLEFGVSDLSIVNKRRPEAFSK